MCSALVKVRFGQNPKHGQHSVWSLFCFFVFLFDSFKVREASALQVLSVDWRGHSFCPCNKTVTVTTFDLDP
jgi:ABC-type microcin C transport system permease subunit YejE